MITVPVDCGPQLAWNLQINDYVVRSPSQSGLREKSRATVPHTGRADKVWSPNGTGYCWLNTRKAVLGCSAATQSLRKIAKVPIKSLFLTTTKLTRYVPSFFT